MANEAALARTHELCDNSIDFTEMMYIEVKDNGGEVERIAVSEKHGFVPLGENFIQIGIQAPIGKFVYENFPTLKVGDTLPNGFQVIHVGRITLPADFKPARKI